MPGQAEPRRVGAFLLFDRQRHIGQCLLQARKPAIPHGPEPVASGLRLVLHDLQGLRRGRVARRGQRRT